MSVRVGPYLRERGFTEPLRNIKEQSAEQTRRESGILSNSLVALYTDLDGKHSGHQRWLGLDPSATSDGRKAHLRKDAILEFYFTRRARKAIKKRRARLLLTESELKAEAGALLGLPCIGMGGVYGWMQNQTPIQAFRLIDWKDRPVEICFDADWASNRDVRQAQLRLADHLTSLGAIVTIRCLWDCVGNGKTGLDDFLMRQGIDGYKQTPSYELSHPVLQKWRAEVTSDTGLPAIDLSPLPPEFLNTAPPPIEFLWQHMLPCRTVALLIGEGAAGKTFFSMQLAVAVATGLPHLGLATRQCPVLYLALEDPIEELRRRIYSVAKHMLPTESRKRHREQLQKNLRLVSLVGEQLHLVELRHGAAVQTRALAELSQLIKSGGFGLVVLDPMSRLHGADENANATGTALINSAERMAREAGCNVLIAHHTGKAVANSGSESAYSARGASGISDAARVVLRLRALDEEEAAKTLILPEDVPATSIVRLVHAKSNYSPRYMDMWLRRDGNGVLHVFHPELRGGAADYTEWLVALKKWARKHATFTKTTVTQSQRKDIFGDHCTRPDAEKLFEQAVAQRDIVAAGKKKAAGGGTLFQCGIGK